MARIRRRVQTGLCNIFHPIGTAHVSRTISINSPKNIWAPTLSLPRRIFHISFSAVALATSELPPFGPSHEAHLFAVDHLSRHSLPLIFQGKKLVDGVIRRRPSDSFFLSKQKFCPRNLESSARLLESLWTFQKHFAYRISL
ncbi:hypothetical protein M9H77_26516 [Catharanthus roseus]|uniref:Uncharacterized protein n=1 Tax=Catharanthus roseus TaxID=4058 RepID=A0ACC0ACK4_CATRO|nr:hypothetical protein M9H77_26516 [Catharanthus roseus]